MIFGWFDASEAKKFGIALAQFFMEKNPVDAPVRAGKLAEKKQEELLGKMGEKIDQFKHAHRLNVYKKAQLGNVFKWTLKEAGYDPAYVDQLTSWLMLKA